MTPKGEEIAQVLVPSYPPQLCSRVAPAKGRAEVHQEGSEWNRTGKEREAGAAGWNPTPGRVIWRKFRASPEPGQFAGDKKSAAVGELSLGLKCSAETPNTLRQTHGKAKGRGHPISDT